MSLSSMSGLTMLLSSDQHKCHPSSDRHKCYPSSDRHKCHPQTSTKLEAMNPCRCPQTSTNATLPTLQTSTNAILKPAQVTSSQMHHKCHPHKCHPQNSTNATLPTSHTSSDSYLCVHAQAAQLCRAQSRNQKCIAIKPSRPAHQQQQLSQKPRR